MGWEDSQNSSSVLLRAASQAALVNPPPRHTARGSVETSRRPPTDSFSAAHGTLDQQAAPGKQRHARAASEERGHGGEDASAERTGAGNAAVDAASTASNSAKRGCGIMPVKLLKHARLCVQLRNRRC